MSRPSVARHHADWLSLVEVSGPFISLPVLLRVFPQGLEPRDPTQAKALRAAYEEWQNNPAAPGNQHTWVMHVLTAVLGYAPEQIAEGQALAAGLEAKMPEMGETLRPHFALVGPAGGDTAGQPQLLIASYTAEQALDKPVIGKHWKATPAARMMELLHGTSVPLGLVTNGEHWMLVYAPRRETTGYASWSGALWLDEPITLRAFHSLFGVRRFFGVSADNTLLAMLKESANDQQEVTDQLGYQVREAVEVLVKSIDALDRENHRALLKDVHETVLYDAALTIMMRLVFLFAAEERGLLHLGKPLYDDNYAVSTLQEQLQEVADQHGEEVLERRFDAWTRLLATFRAVHGGIQHQDLLMPAYGGSLFDPDRYPFLEGRVPQSSWKTSAAEPLAVNNRVVLHLLNSLQRLRMRVPGGGPAESRRISFRALGVEQIGHVYEGLLDRTAVRAGEPVLGVKGAGHREQEIPLATLESLFAQSRDKLIEFLKDETGRSLSALRHALDEVNLLDEHRFLITCGQDKKLLERIRPFVNLIGDDFFGRPLVTLAGSIYVTTAAVRRSTGTHYTPPSLTEPIVQHTLDPLVYEGPAEGLPPELWKLKSPKAILELKVCDVAMGSGAFLVQACRYMAERLVQAWENLEKQHPGEVLITPEGKFSIGSPSERLVPAETNERIAIALRIVADRCLYGVDITPMAVEMAKLSLWLITVQRDRPFTFLDHALKCGDSLLGVSSIQQVDNFSLRSGERQVTFATANLSRYVEEASAKRRILEELPCNDQMQIETKNRLHAEAEAATAKVKALADCLIAYELRSLGGNAYEEQRTVAAEHAEQAMQSRLPEFQVYAREQLCGRHAFHWPLEFPEVFNKGGFNAFCGNPPYLGGRKIRGTLGGTYLDYLTTCLFAGTSANADLCAFFVRRASDLTRLDGMGGFVATSSISEGDTRDVCLQPLLDNGGSIVRASSKSVWPGTASVTYSPIWIAKNNWKGDHVLDGKLVNGINSYLTETDSIDLPPYRLKANYELSYQGSIPLGKGFVLRPDEAAALLAADKRNEDVIYPYLVGQELNIHPTHQPSQWIINFHDWPLDRDSAPPSYSGSVAADYPECLEIIRDRVYPERTRRDANGEFKLRKPLPQKWWIYGDKRPELYAKLRSLKWALAIATQATKYVAFGIVAGRKVYSHAIAIIASDRYALAGILASSVHEVWARRYGGYNLLLLRYSPSDLFDTFPLPALSAKLDKLGEAYCTLRAAIMAERGEGLTATYNRFNDVDTVSADVIRLRTLQVELDQAVVAAYGWSGMDLGRGFHKTKQGVRYTINEAARREILDHLLALNHQRHAEEEAEKAAQAVTAPVKRSRVKRDKTDKFTLDLL